MSVCDSTIDIHRIWRPCLLFTAVIKTSVCILMSTFDNLLILFIFTLVTLYSLITWIDWTYLLLVSNCTVQLLGITSLIVLNVVYGLPRECFLAFLAITISMYILSFVSFLLSLLTLISKQYRLSKDMLLPSNINGVLNEYGEYHESYRKRIQSYLEAKYQMLEYYDEKKRKDEELAKNIIGNLGSKGSLVTEDSCDLRESEALCQAQQKVKPTNEGNAHQACPHCTDELVEKTADQSPCPAEDNHHTEHHSKDELNGTDSHSGTTSEHPVEGDEKDTPQPVGRTSDLSPKGGIADVASLASSPMGKNLELEAKVSATSEETVIGQNVPASTDANNPMPENHTTPESGDKDIPRPEEYPHFTPGEDVSNTSATGNPTPNAISGNTNLVEEVVGKRSVLQSADNAHLSNADVSPIIQLPSNCEDSKECPDISPIVELPTMIGDGLPIVQLPTFVEEKEAAGIPPSHCLSDSHAEGSLNFTPEENTSRRSDRGVDFGEGGNADLVEEGDRHGKVTVDEQENNIQSADGVDVGNKVGLDTSPFIQLPSRLESDGV